MTTHSHQLKAVNIDGRDSGESPNKLPAADRYVDEWAFAAWIGASIGYVRRLRYEQKGPHVFRVGRLVRYRQTGPDSIAEWVESGQAACEHLGSKSAPTRKGG